MKKIGYEFERYERGKNGRVWWGKGNGEMI